VHAAQLGYDEDKPAKCKPIEKSFKENE